MNRLAHLLLRLYPKAWRERYGEEIRTLIEDRPAHWQALPDLARGAMKEQFKMQSFTRLVGWLSAAGLVAGFAASFAVTPQYFSHAVFSLDAPNAADILQTAKVELLSRRRLAEIIDNPRLKLYDEEKKHEPLEDAEDRMRRDLLISADQGRIGVAFTYRDPNVAKATVADIIDTLNYIIQTDSRKLYIPAYLGARESKYAEEIGRLEGAIALLEGNPQPPALKVFDPPSQPTHSISPNRAAFAACGLGAGILIAFLIALFRRGPQPTPCPS
jgi:hypothetical protein